MKRNIIITLALLAGFFTSCNSFLDIDPLDKVQKDKLTASEKGLSTLLANVYQRIPMEDYNYIPLNNFNYRTYMGGNNATSIAMYTDEALKADGGPFGRESFSYWPYGDIRQVNTFIETVKEAAGKGTVSAAEADRLTGEAVFARAYIYFALAKRYGGVPIIDRVQDGDYETSGAESLFVPRSTEKETWTFVLDEFQKAADLLPETSSQEFRATKYAAYAMLSRAALHAASVAKYWNEAPLDGEAVKKELVGMKGTDADAFYQRCIDASEKVIASNKYALYEANPASPAAAAANFQKLFRDGANTSEYIFGRGYADGSIYSNQGHSFAQRFTLHQVNPGTLYHGRFNPTLDIVDLFEDYTDNGTGASAPIVTRESGDEKPVEHFGNPNYSFDVKSMNLKKYDTPYAPFENKDARLLASIVVPGSTYGGTKIILQGGMINTKGESVIYRNESDVLNGETYYALGGQTNDQVSGFVNIGAGESGNWSTTGFGIRKFLPEGESVKTQDWSSTFTFIDIRLAEIYLNYAEAQVESGKGEASKAKKYLNALRHRAGHTDDIPLTLANVLKERRVELTFEGQRYWDLMRRREFHKEFASNRIRMALVPMIDLTGAEPKYVFVRAYQLPDENRNGCTFQTIDYYGGIPNASSDGQVNNPGR